MNGFDLFKADTESLSVGKSIKAIQNSEVGRNKLIALFGGINNLPSSIMRAEIPKVTETTDLPGVERSHKNTTPGYSKSKDEKLPKELRQAFSISGKGAQAGLLSIFPQNIGRSVVLLYSEPNDLVFDPFAGHNSRMSLVVNAGRDYIGCDLSTEFMKFNTKKAKELREEFPNRRIEVYHIDSRQIKVENDIADMLITSPPYYDIEYYGDESEQLGKCKTYKGFLEGMQLVMNHTHRILKKDTYAIWFINDFRRKGKFYSYHTDIQRLGKKAGFILHDLLIVDLRRAFRDCFINQTISSKILPKRHEFGVVFYKPKE